MRRIAPVVIGLAITTLLVSYVVYTQSVVRALGREASRTASMFARVYAALTDPTPDAATTALLDLSARIGAMGVPVVMTDSAGTPTIHQNLPFNPVNDDRFRDYVAALDRENPPVPVPGGALIHYGYSPIATWLRIIPVVQAVVLALMLAAGVGLLRARTRADRERVWAGMARESAHQLGTPLSSLNGWVELLAERASDGPSASAITHMRGDLERLERVAHRFERIGRPPRREPVNVGALVDRVAAYFRARVPTLAHPVRIDFAPPGERLVVDGDPVLLEWAIEALVKNAIDALADRGGTIRLEAAPAVPSGVIIRIADNGPGISRDLRRRVFDAGFSTKEAGWGIGLSLARRIVERAHRGTLTHVITADPGATFEIILR
jgi:signal transduction histidine kinase